MVRITLIALSLVSVSQLALAQGAPLQLGGGSPASNAIKKATPPARVSNQDAATLVRKANAYLNSITTMVSDFVQVGADGRRTSGKLYIHKPGRLRFEYANPSPLEIVADGSNVAIRNRKLNTQDMYFIGQTPLKFLLKGNIDLARDTKILDVSSRGGEVSVQIEDRATLGGTSRITMIFREEDFRMVRWIVNDPQGSDTMVTLANVDLQEKPEASLFRINYERLDSN